MSGEQWVISPTGSTVGFSVRHLGFGTVHGRFTRCAGRLRIPGLRDGRGAAAGTVDVASLRSDDAERDAFLRSAAFLDAERHPQMRFQARAIRDAGRVLAIEGELEIRGIPQPVTLQAERLDHGIDPNILLLRVTGQVDRRTYGLRVTRGLMGDRSVSGTVRLELDLELHAA